MGLFEQFPYTNFHELNLDWILAAVKKSVEIVKTYDDRLTTLEDALQSYQKVLDDQLRVILSEMIADGDFDTVFQSVASITTEEIDDILGGTYNAG